MNCVGDREAILTRSKVENQNHSRFLSWWKTVLFPLNQVTGTKTNAFIAINTKFMNVCVPVIFIILFQEVILCKGWGDYKSPCHPNYHLSIVWIASELYGWQGGEYYTVPICKYYQCLYILPDSIKPIHSYCSAPDTVHKYPSLPFRTQINQKYVSFSISSTWQNVRHDADLHAQ